MASTPAQLSFALNNPGAPSTVYISAEVSANQLTLVFTSSVAAKFTPGTVVPVDQAMVQPSGSLLYLDLSRLGLTETEFSALTLDGSDWASANYYSPNSQLIGFTPAQTMNLGTGGSFSLTLNQFAMANPPSTPTVQLNVTYFRVDGVTQGAIPLVGNFAVATAYPPDQNDQDLPRAIQATLYPNAVVNCDPNGTPLTNSLKLTFSPGSTPASVVAGSGTKFILSFIYAEDRDGFGAMMTPAQAQPPIFTVSADTNASAWAIVPAASNQSPSWDLIPPEGQPILGAGANSVVSFAIGGLVTNFQPGPTVVLVAYENVPGYRDGTFSIVVQKLGHVQVQNFSASPAQIALDRDGGATVTVSWTAYYATRLLLLLSDSTSGPSLLTAAQPKTIDVTGLSSYTARITDSTQFELVADGQSPDDLIDNRSIAYCTAYVMPVIETFSADPQYIAEGSPNDCVISWKVNAPSATQVTISSTVPDLPSLLYPLEGTTRANFSEPQVLTLKAVPRCGYPVASAQFNIASLPVITRFSVNPSTIPDGLTYGVSTISWSVMGSPGTTVTLTVNRSTTSVGMSASGTYKLYDAQTVTLTAVAPSGSPTATASVRVTQG